MMMTATLNGLRKTAVLMLAIGDEHASQILQRLPAGAAAQVRQEMTRVGPVPPVVRREICHEFCCAVDEPVATAVAHPPFARLANASPSDLQRAVAHEHPQTIALMLIY